MRGNRRILFFPFGNHVDFASFYLEHAWENEQPPENWYACVQFALVLWNVDDPSVYVSHGMRSDRIVVDYKLIDLILVATHRFNAEEGDWGFTRFSDLRRLFTHQVEGHNTTLVQNDEAYVTAYVRVVKDPTGVLWHNLQNYDSKKETGMVGLKNQGATCYLNSLLQSLYFTNAFRKVWTWPQLLVYMYILTLTFKAVYQIPTEAEATRENSAWTLQKLFYSLQTSEVPVSTAELTASFGWESRQIFEQQDVQELSRKLMERLEERMKGTPAENALANLFVGKTKTYISCINVAYESSRVEDFWDIQLNVRGLKTLEDSFEDYIQVETLEGENKYDAGPPYGLQDAKKGVIFESFPPVLHLHLKRFEYDINRDAMMKLNDRHAFPMEFDASPYMSNEADKSEPWIYQLHGVLVHSGDFNAGHYYAYLKPGKDGSFYRFDDDKVIRATDKEALDENFGGEYELPNGTVGVRQPYTRALSTKRSMNAYMLVYIRKSRLDDVLLPITKDDVPSHIGMCRLLFEIHSFQLTNQFPERRLVEDRAEFLRRKKEREEAHLYLHIGILTEESFKAHHGFDLTSADLPDGDPALPTQYRVLRAKRMGELTEELATEKGLKPEQIRFWIMVNRQNKTTRPDQVIKDPELTVEDACNKFGTKGNPVRLYMEVGEPGPDGIISWPSSETSVLVFLKHFDVFAQTLTGVAGVYVRKAHRVAELAPTILQLMNWPTGTDFILFEEIKHTMIEHMKPKQTFQQSEIQDGDVITFQRSVKESELPPHALYADAKQYYDYLLNRMSVNFIPIKAAAAGGKGEESKEFTLVLSRKMTYDQLSRKVGEHLDVDPTHLRFAPVMSGTGKPKQALRRNMSQNLYQILNGQYGAYGYSMHQPDTLYYEVLEMSLSDFESKKCLKVTWLTDGISKEVSYITCITS